MKKHLPLAACLGLIVTAHPVSADPIDTSRILAAVSGDFNKDTQPDLAMLVANDESGGIDIHILIGDSDHAMLKPFTVAKDKVFGNTSIDGMFGQDATIAALPNGSISVQSRNDAIGRDRWNQTLTIAWRNGDFIVAGFTYSYYDTLDPDSNGSCDFNVLTGKGKKNDAAFRVEPAYVTLVDWRDETGLKACRIGQ